jgi:hypothetical protein
MIQHEQLECEGCHTCSMCSFTVSKDETKNNSHSCFATLSQYLAKVLADKDQVIALLRDEIHRKNASIKHMIYRQGYLEKRLQKIDGVLSFDDEEYLQQSPAPLVNGNNKDKDKNGEAEEEDDEDDGEETKQRDDLSILNDEAALLEIISTHAATENAGGNSKAAATISEELKEEFVKLNKEGLQEAKVFLKTGNWKEYEKGEGFLIKVSNNNNDNILSKNVIIDQNI